ncbi:MAG: DUF4421 domain-containing protein [Prolixibacteraceae bacterium]
MKKLFLSVMCMWIAGQCWSQKKERVAFDLDTNYVKTYYNDLIVRIYSANRNNFVRFLDTFEDLELKYRPNDYFDLGAGINYKWFGLNVGSKIGKLSNDDERFGKTSTFGLQSYLYARKFTVDIMAMKTRGYYLKLENDDFERQLEPEQYYQRRDIRTKNIGVNLNYVLNYRRFSYKAAFKQNDLQKKSAGSVILGGGVYLLKVSADSALVPREIATNYFTGWRELDAFKTYSINGNVEYAYSWVPLRNWIATGSWRVSLGLQKNIWELGDEGVYRQVKFGRSGMIRLSGGHHFPEFYLGFSYVRYQHNAVMRMNSMKTLNGTNYIEFTVSKRIKL